MCIHYPSASFGPHVLCHKHHLVTPALQILVCWLCLLHIKHNPKAHIGLLVMIIIKFAKIIVIIFFFNSLSLPVIQESGSKCPSLWWKLVRGLTWRTFSQWNCWQYGGSTPCFLLLCHIKLVWQGMFVWYPWIIDVRKERLTCSLCWVEMVHMLGLMQYMKRLLRLWPLYSNGHSAICYALI